MNPRKYFERYYLKLRMEAWLKSLLAGLIVGLSAAFATAFATWFTTDFGLWISLGVFAVVTAAVTVLFYFKRYKLTAEKSAKRIDRYGLEERLITMVEYDGDDSYIAQAQREDAKAELAKFEAKQIKFIFPTKVIVTCAICAVLGIGMTTVTGLSAAGVLPDGVAVWKTIFPDGPEVRYSVLYEAEEGGFILGDSSQQVVKDQDGELVVAVAEDGFMFKSWSDGEKNPARQDTATTELSFTAIFIPVDDLDADESEDEEEADDVPDSEGGSGEGDGKGQSNGSGGKYDDYNQIINGGRYYREYLEAYQEAITELLKQNESNLTDEQIEIIKSYIDIV